MFNRLLSQTLLDASSVFSVIALTGPRQSGKTTLLKYLLPDYAYFSLESPDTLLLIKSDPRDFLIRHGKGVIIDEAQKYPDLFSYIQEEVDNNDRPSRIVLSGSQNFLMAEKISQTLAGRVAIFELLPLSYEEYASNKEMSPPNNLWDYLFTGSYPRPYQEKLPIDIWYDSYIRTYLERDVRSLINVKDLSQFQLFLKFCAGQHGQEFNASAIANNLAISQTTVMNWLSILEASYLIFRLNPYYKNFKKRLSKRSKLYFYDTAIVCHLLGITSSDQLAFHSSRGAIFEGFVISELAKKFLAQGKRYNFYYWREHAGHEIDLLVEQGERLSAIEIKSSQTISDRFCVGLDRLKKLAGEQLNTFIVYSGITKQYLAQHEVIPWQSLDTLYMALI